MWIFKSIKNYEEMVDKIANSVFVISTILLFLLSQANDGFFAILEKMSFGAYVEIFNLKLHLAVFYIPFIMGVLEHAFKIHDKFSSILGIRKKYDKNVVVKNIVAHCNIKNVNKLSDKQVCKIMSSCFYRFASSTNPVIDSHYITLTLTEWCWFWTVLDTLIMFIIVGVIWLILSWWNWRYFFVVIAIVIFLLVLLILVYMQTKKYTKKEISAIFSITDEEKTDNVNIKVLIGEAVKNALSDK